jgi:Polyketide cyclase / dehydrase and lipid transport
MFDITVSAETSATPEQVIRGAADFSAARAKIWSNSKPKFLVVHDQGADFAEVTEGLRIGGVFWERSRYDWSEPGTIRQQVIESNVIRPGSTWELTATPREGGSEVAMRLRRDFLPTLRGRAGWTFNHVGGRVGWRSYLRRALKQIERRPA